MVCFTGWQFDLASFRGNAFYKFIPLKAFYGYSFPKWEIFLSWSCKVVCCWPGVEWVFSKSGCEAMWNVSDNNVRMAVLSQLGHLIPWDRSISSGTYIKPVYADTKVCLIFSSCNRLLFCFSVLLSWTSLEPSPRVWVSTNKLGH